MEPFRAGRLAAGPARFSPYLLQDRRFRFGGRDILGAKVYAKHHRRAKFLFGLADVVLAAVAFETAYRIRLHLPFEHLFYFTGPVRVLLELFSLMTLVLLGVSLRVYERMLSASKAVLLRDAFRQCFLAGAALILFQYSLRLDVSRFFLALYLGMVWILLSLFRFRADALVGFIQREFSAPRDVLVVGQGERAHKAGLLLERAGVRLIGFLSLDETAEREITLGKVYPLRPLCDLPVLLKQQVVDEVVFAVNSANIADLEDVFLMCDEEGVQTRVSVDFFPHVNSHVYLDTLYQAPLLTFSAAPYDEIQLLVKRITDIVVATAALALLAPFMLLVALLVKTTSKGPVLFRQQRCGLNGRLFPVYKFRSMVADAEQMKAGVAHMNVKTTAFKIPNDPRVTPVGRWLRKFSIDEWPQLLHVLRGQMSLVGPRPAVPEEVELYERWQRRRLRMRPGLTCLWALAGRDQLDFDSWMKLDLEYIDNWSLALDWKIILRTIPRVLSGKGAN